MPARKRRRASGQLDDQSEVADLFRRWLRCIARGRKAYSDADKTLDEILRQAEPGATIRIVEHGKEKDLTLVDQFAETNKVWAGSACSRYKIEVRPVKPQEATGGN